MSVRVIVRTASELCITVGTLIVLFVVYVLFWTGVKADSEMEHQVDLLQDRWAKQPVRPTSGPGPSAAPEPPAAYESGDPFALMRDLRRMGLTNSLTDRRRKPLRRETLVRMAEIYTERFADSDGRLPATFEIVWLSGWAPHESQQQPLKPGSAQTRLADALGVKERSAGEKAGECVRFSPR